MGLLLSAAPAAEPITLAQMKADLRVDHTAEDTLITARIKTARQWVENRTGRQLITATWKETFDCFPRGPIYLQRPPLQSVTSLKYIDTAGVQQTWAASKYKVLNNTRERGRIEPAFGETWPSTRAESEAVEVIFKAGYGDAASDVEDEAGQLLDAIYLFVNDRDAFRSDSIAGTIISSIPRGVEALCAPFAVKGVM